MSFRTSPMYRKCIQPVSIEDLALGLHVGSSAVVDEFPMQPPSSRSLQLVDEELEKTQKLTFTDIPYNKAMFAIKTAFQGEAKWMAVMTRLTTLQEMSEAPGMEKWIKWRAKNARGDNAFEFADALMDVAAQFPFRPGTFRFNLKPFLREVQRTADLKYGGQFT